MLLIYLVYDLLFNMDICELLSYGEEGKIYINNTDNNLSNSFISLGNGNEDTDKLKLIISHKDELLAHKIEIIENQKRELELLREMLNTLKNKS